MAGGTVREQGPDGKLVLAVQNPEHSLAVGAKVDDRLGASVGAGVGASVICVPAVGAVDGDEEGGDVPMFPKRRRRRLGDGACSTPS